MRVVKVALLSLAAALMLSVSVMADRNFVPPVIGGGIQIQPGQLILQFKPGLVPSTLEELQGVKMAVGLASVDALFEKYSVTSIRKVFSGSKTPDPASGFSDLTGFYLVDYPSVVDVLTAVKDFGFDDNIVTAEPVYWYPMQIEPNDPEDSLQYWLSNGTHGMKLYQAWDTQPGDSVILFGDIDSGVNYRHPDLQKNIWVNPGEDLNHNGVVFDSADINGVDDDGNGKVDDLDGWDFLPSQTGCAPFEDCNGPDNNPMDMNGHGTFIAGIVAGVTNDAQGIAGIGGGWQPYNPGVRIVCLRAGYLANTGLGYINSAAASQATDYARLNGVDVINYSFGRTASLPCDVNYGYSAAFAASIRTAIAAGMYVTHAAGNEGLNCPEWKDTIPGVITVSALNKNDVIASWSNYGSWIDLSGPGAGIYSTSSDSGLIGYRTYDGTSFSAPAVAAVAALLKSQQPTLTLTELQNLISNYAENVDGYNSPSYAGLIGRRPNVGASMQALPDANFEGGFVAGNAPFSTTFNDISPNNPTSWLWSFGDGQTSTEQRPPAIVYSTPGLYSVSLTVTEPRGTNKHTKWNSILVTADTVSLADMYIGTGTDTIEVPISLTNTATVDQMQIPITWKGATVNTLLLNVVDISGTRCAGFEQAIFSNIYNGGKVATLDLRANMGGGHAPLAAGSGVICKVRFQVTNALKNQKICIRDTVYSSFTQSLTHGLFTYQGAFQGACVTVGSPAVCGDANGDGGVDISDAVYLIAYIFSGGPAPSPYSTGEVNCDGSIDISDAVYLISYIFSGGPAPCAGC